MSAHLTVVDQVAFRPLTFRPACTTCDWTGTETELNGDAIKEGASHEETPDQGAPVDDLKARLAKVKSGDEVTVLTRQGCTVVGPVKEASGFLVLDGRVLRPRTQKGQPMGPPMPIALGVLTWAALGVIFVLIDPPPNSPRYLNVDLPEHAPSQSPPPMSSPATVLHRIRADSDE